MMIVFLGGLIVGVVVTWTWILIWAWRRGVYQKKELFQEQMGHDTHQITHEFVLRRVYKKGERTLVPDENLGCGYVTYHDHNAGAVDGTTHCGRPLSEHPMVIRNYRDGAIDE